MLKNKGIGIKLNVILVTLNIKCEDIKKMMPNFDGTFLYLLFMFN
jgi:hypothetical protein